MSRDWWARKLGGNGTSLPSTPPPATPRPSYGGVPTASPPPGNPHAYENLSQALQDPSVWEGRGQASKTEGRSRCPACSSPNFFSRRNAMSRFGAPAPHCFDCGYPLIQFGSELGAGNTPA